MAVRVYGDLEISAWKRSKTVLIEVQSPLGADSRIIPSDEAWDEPALIEDLMSAFKIFLRNPKAWWAEREEEKRRGRDVATLEDNLWFTDLAERLTPYLPEAIEAFEQDEIRRAEQRHRVARPDVGPKEWMPGTEEIRRRKKALMKALQRQLKRPLRPQG